MRTPKKRIVCGTDFSLHSAEASEVAALLAKRLDDTLDLIHVTGKDGAAPEIHQTIQAASREKLHQEAERLRKLGPTVREELLTGSASEKLVEAGRLSSTRLIVVASIGWVAPSQFLVGSVAERTAEYSPTPTLVVRRSDTLTGWLRGENRLKVFVCYDLASGSDSVLDWTKELLELGPCDVTIAYVAWPPHETERLGREKQASLVAIPSEHQTLLERDVRQRALSFLGPESVNITVLSSWGRPDMPLLDQATEVKADLIVVGTHQRHGLSRFRLGSVSRTILHHAIASVAIIPVGATFSPDGPLPEFKCVLAATDFSEFGNRAIPYAYSALPHGGVVCLLHVIRADTSKETGGDDIETLKRKLRDLTPSEAEARGIKTEVHVIVDPNPATAISQAAERLSADLICMGSHGRSGIARTILGSVAQGVMTQTTKPLMVLRGTRM